ncbi:6362_t:CDS:1, partial [Funneliformis geosporum]
SYYAKLRNINELARPLAVAGFNLLVRSNKMRKKMTGRSHPVPVNNPYNANASINNEAEFLNWLQGKYRE